MEWIKVERKKGKEKERVKGRQEGRGRGEEEREGMGKKDLNRKKKICPELTMLPQC